MTGGSQLHEEDGSDKITFRLPTRLKEQYKEDVDNMSVDLEDYVRRRVNEPESDDVEPWEAPDDRELATAYRKLCEQCNHQGTVRGPTAKKLLAQVIGSVDQDDAYRLLAELASRGYVKLVNEIPPATTSPSTSGRSRPVPGQEVLPHMPTDTVVESVGFAVMVVFVLYLIAAERARRAIARVILLRTVNGRDGNDRRLRGGQPVAGSARQ